VSLSDLLKNVGYLLTTSLIGSTIVIDNMGGSLADESKSAAV